MRDFCGEKTLESKAEALGLSFHSATTWKVLGQVLGGDKVKKTIQGK